MRGSSQLINDFTLVVQPCCNTLRGKRIRSLSFNYTHGNLLIAATAPDSSPSSACLPRSSHPPFHRCTVLVWLTGTPSPRPAPRCVRVCEMDCLHRCQSNCIPASKLNKIDEGPVLCGASPHFKPRLKLPSLFIQFLPESPERLLSDWLSTCLGYTTQTPVRSFHYQFTVPLLLWWAL